ncbi:MAG: GNAT family N-acetyltransferase [Cyanobacteria bacterium P01_D01_bin.105]
MLTIREANSNDERVVARHLRSIFSELDFPEESIKKDWLERTSRFIDRAHQELSYRCFVAEIQGKIIGSASCQILELYPMISNAYQKGYIWGVYVEPAYRRQGIATTLMSQASSYLKEIGCTQVVLHASEVGKQLYASLGYQESNEMVLTLG